MGILCVVLNHLLKHEADVYVMPSRTQIKGCIVHRKYCQNNVN
jgi:hypothetical protein